MNLLRQYEVVSENLILQVIAYNPAFSQITGGINTGILLNQCIYWCKKKYGKEFYKTDEEFCYELGLGLHQLRAARKSLMSSGFITVKRKRIPAKNHFTINFEKIIRGLYIAYFRRHFEINLKIRLWKNLDIVFRLSEHCSFKNSETNTKNTTNNTNNSTKVTFAEQKNENKDLSSTEGKMSKLNQSSIDEPIQRKRKVLTDPVHLKILQVYQELIYSAVKPSTKSCFEGIPKAVSLFKEHFGTEARP